MSDILLTSVAQDDDEGKVKEPGLGIKHGGRSVFETGAENAVEIEAKAGSQEVETVAATIEDVECVDYIAKLVIYENVSRRQ